MANKMLIDATHPEETRVVVLRGSRVEEFDFESAHRKQLRGNIYLAKVTRVEPSLQAAFVDYGGNRHGFLAFSEIHPDYYQIPVADRQALIDEEERAQRAAEDEADRRARHRRRPPRAAARHDDVTRGDVADVPGAEPDTDASAAAHPADGLSGSEAAPFFDAGTADEASAHDSAEALRTAEDMPAADETPAAEAEPDQPPAVSAFEDAAEEPDDSHEAAAAVPVAASEPVEGVEDDAAAEMGSDSDGEAASAAPAENGETAEPVEARSGEESGDDDETVEEVVESVGGADALEEVPDRAPRYRRQYKIQEVIKRRQVMLVQVVKEERGTKGAALTTYLSLAGRYSVLMPNTARGGGISRKITSAEDRARLKEAAAELEVPEGMGVILRTAGASRTKLEIKRDFEYLLRLWETVRDLTLKSTAPRLVYEEGSLVKRSIRDLYSKDIDEIVVAGPAAYEEAKDFMRMLMPSHAKNVKLYGETQPLLSRYGVENQLDAMFSPVVQLRSGGYIVINQAEALVAIDVNSGRATREHHIEDTALKTNLEAADEIARQLRLRDLAGLIVIDFIDMDENRNNRAVERRLKECLKQDRARIQVGRISHFGLLEMSRQRIRASVLESSTEKFPYCGGSGHVRSVSSLALQVLRALEEQLMRSATHNLVARTRPDVALYVLNQKRAHLRALEERFAITITVVADETVRAPQAFVIERGEQVHTVEAARALAEQNLHAAVAAPLEEEDDLEESEAPEEPEGESEGAAPDSQAEGGSRRRRRRRRRGGRGGEAEPSQQHAYPQAGLEQEGETIEVGYEAPVEAEFAAEPVGEASPQDERDEEHGEARREGEPRRRRRGRRGGRRNRRDRNGEAAQPPRQGGYEADADDEPAAYAPENAFAPPEELTLTSPPAIEPALQDAAADLDSGTAVEPAAAETEQPPASAPAAAAEPAAPPAEEPPRRRSTVREPAPIAAAGDMQASTPQQPVTPSPPPEPVITETDEGEQAEKPRRSGWWSRRLAGG